MKRILSIYLFTFLVFSKINAQSTFQVSNSGLPAYSNILDFTRDNNGNIFTIVGIGGDKTYVYKSMDKGATWTVINSTGLPSSFSCIEFLNNNLFIGAETDNGIMYKSTDNGQNWSLSNSGLPETFYIYGLTSSSNSLFANVSIGGDKTYIYKSTDNGSTWTNVNQTGLPNSFYSIQYINNSLLVGTLNGGNLIYKSTDGGQSWTSSDTGLPLIANIFGFTTINSVVYSLVNIYGDKGYIYKSTDNGSSWSALQSTGLPTGFISIGSSLDAILVGTWDDDSYIYKSESIVTSINYLQEDAGVNFYPNPVENEIHFSIPITGEIYDSRGILINTFTNSKMFDFGEMPSGLYLIKGSNSILRVLKK